jgi:hypothetical protein
MDDSKLASPDAETDNIEMNDTDSGDRNHPANAAADGEVAENQRADSQMLDDGEQEFEELPEEDLEGELEEDLEGELEDDEQDAEEEDVHEEDEEGDGTTDSAEREAQIEAASQPFLGRWNRLVSTTNWEKGRIILQWREALIAADATPDVYADEAWGRTVGGVTGQHVGRLRRVSLRFGSTHQRFEGLFWSHFHAAADWEDAEMWLEGALRNKWSVSKMRSQRWETLGQIEAERPREEDVVHSELDEDYETGNTVAPAADRDVAEGPRHEDSDFGDGPENTGGIDALAAAREDELPTVRPFEDLPDLPDDMVDAFEAMKLAILRHKGSKWTEVPLDDVLTSLESLKQLALAPSSDGS